MSNLTRPVRPLLAVACLLAGCSGDAPTAEEATTGVAASAVVAPLTLAEPNHHLDDLAREPMLAEHPSGALFVAGYGSQVTGTDPNSAPQLWRSDDGGTTWERVDVGSTGDGAAGNSDVDLAVAPDGTLYFLAMGFDRSIGEGTHIALGVSRDLGDSWSWTYLSQDRFDDRPWIEVAPNGTAHAIWNDGSGVSHAVSSDGGRTWVERPRIHDRGGSSHLAIGPAGEIAVRVTPLSASGNRYDEDLELIAVSSDGGVTFSKQPPPGERAWDPTFSDPEGVPRWVEPLAWDAAGALYHLWSEGRVVMLARSLDRGESWQSWQVAEEAEVAYFPYLVARGEGELAATWFSGRGESMAVEVALLRAPADGGGEPVVGRSPSFQIDAWRESEGSPMRDPGGEYVPVAFLGSGGLGVVSPIQDAAGDRWGFTWWRIANE